VVPTIVALILVGSYQGSDDEGDTTMVEGQSMTTVADVVAQVRDGRVAASCEASWVGAGVVSALARLGGWRGSRRSGRRPP
jgi:hypothetical protein